MKQAITLIILIAIILLMFSCGKADVTTQIAATTLPVYEFTKILCAETGISVSQVISENISCLHDYTLQVKQMRLLESAEMVIISGAGLESFLDDVIISTDNLVDASAGIELLCPGERHHAHDDHTHDADPHYWLSPTNAQIMAANILSALCSQYPDHEETFIENYNSLTEEIETLKIYAEDNLQNLACADLITFHDGFSYLADAYDLHILKAVEEESGSEASAQELSELCELVLSHDLSAVFTEKNGSVSAAKTIAAETGCGIYQLDMAISGESYFTAMRHNIDTLKEALG